MNARLLALLALLGALLLAGCSFKAESDDDDDGGDSDTTISAGGGDGDDDKDSPSASIGAVLSVLGVAVLALAMAAAGCGDDTADNTGNQASGSLVIAYTTYVYLNRRMSDLVLAGSTGSWWDGVEFTLANTCSTMVVVPRKLWNAVGGFDEGFVGWGWEDCAFSAACAALGGGRAVGRLAG